MADSDDDFAGIEVIVDRTVQRGAPLVAAAVRPPQDALLMIGGPSAAAAPSSPSTATDPVVALTRYLTSNERRVVSLTAVGYAQHGKSTLLSRIFGVPNNASQDDVARGMTTQCRVHSAALSGATEKTTHFFSVVDTPGDPSFVQDVRAGISLTSSCLLCVDAVEGVHPVAEAQLRTATSEKVRVVLVITKLDRLITELKLPPKDAYKHLKAIVDTLNVVAGECGAKPFSVPQGDVIFTSARYGVAFTVPSMAAKYALEHAGRVDPIGLAKRLWGPVSFDATQNRFVPLTASSGSAPSFVDLVLAPLYKVFTDSLSGGSAFTTKQVHESAAAAVKNAIENTFGKLAPVFVDCLLHVCPTGHDARPGRIAQLVTEWCAANNRPAPRLLAVAPIATASGKDLLSNVRVEIGELRSGQQVTLITAVDSVFNAKVTSLSVRNVDGLVRTDVLRRGVVGFVEGLSELREGQHAYIIGVDDVPPSVPAAPSADHAVVPRVHVSLEAVKHDDAKAMEEALRRLVSLHPGCSVRVEDAGDHVLMGTGELYLDVALHDLRVRFLGVEKPIRLTDPYVAFTETVSATRGVLRTARDGDVSLAIVASRMPPKMTEAFERGVLNFAMPLQQLASAIVADYGWDEVAAEGIAAVGPDPFFGPNVLVNDVLSNTSLLDNTVPADVVEAIAAGFRVATRRGPVCGEALRGVCFTIVDFTLPPGRMSRQVRTTLTNLARNVCRAAFLSAAPRLMEPYVAVDITTRPQHAAAITAVLARRRGNLSKTVRLASTPLSRLQCVVPLIDSFGLDTEIRLMTRDEVLCTTSFAHWSVVPGDPLDDSVNLLPLQSATGAQLARDFALKTRRKKGLPDAIDAL